jgi:hypothetical protein
VGIQANKEYSEIKIQSQNRKTGISPIRLHEGSNLGRDNEAWVAFMISNDNHDQERKEYYAAVIQKLQGELGVDITPFPELKNR